jgi:hypothetical protein
MYSLNDHDREKSFVTLHKVWWQVFDLDAGKIEILCESPK